MLGIEPDYNAFDTDIIVGINSSFGTLFQLGVGPDEAFSITGPEETWDQFLEGKRDLNSVKSYIFIKTKLMFDPPSTSYASDALNKIAEEQAWRLNVAEEGRRYNASG